MTAIPVAWTTVLANGETAGRVDEAPCPASDVAFSTAVETPFAIEALPRRSPTMVSRSERKQPLIQDLTPSAA